MENDHGIAPVSQFQDFSIGLNYSLSVFPLAQGSNWPRLMRTCLRIFQTYWTVSDCYRTGEPTTRPYEKQ